MVLKVKNNGYRMVVSVQVFAPCGHESDWQLWLTGAPEHHEKVSYNMLLAWEKIQIQNSKYGFCQMCIIFTTL